MFDMTEYSLDTPKDLYENILNKKLYSLIKNDKLYGGSTLADTNSTSIISLITSLIIIIVGFILYWYKNIFIEIDAKIHNISCDEDKSCDISINYIVNTTQYSKVLRSSKKYSPNDKIKIYYNLTNPNIIQLYNFNYEMVGIGIITLGVLFFLTSIYCIV